MRRSRSWARSVTSACGVTALVAGTFLAAPASSADPEPVTTVEQRDPAVDERGSWRSTSVAGTQTLTWRSPLPLPLTDARVEFRLGDRLLGYPRLSGDGRTLTLVLSTGAQVDVDRVGAWLSGRRLDVAAPGPRSRLGPVEQAPVGPTEVPAVDHGEPGALDVVELDYIGRGLPWREYEGDLEVVGHAVLPQGVTDAPLVLFLHGRHQACYGGRGDNGGWPCAGRSKPVPSHLGYDYLQRMLASQGYATVSIAANGINQQDWASPDGGASARSALVRHHLELLAGWTADPARTRWHDRLDLRRTVLVGHSRGGEGVNQAAIETLPGAPYRLVGQTLIAPTDFGYQTAGYLPTVTLLPYCDGDVFDLQGQRFVDGAAGLSDGDPSLRSSVLMRGANHNFFNTEWTPRISQAPSFDDWYEKDHGLCGSVASATRLTAGEQRRAARTFIGASVAAFVTREQSAVDVVDAARPVRIPEAGGAVAWTHAIGGNRRRVALGDGATRSGNATACRALTPRGPTGEAAVPRCAPGGRWNRPLHWVPAYDFAAVQSAALAGGVPRHLRVRWTEPGGEGGMTFDSPLDLSAPGAALDLRVLAEPGEPTARFAVRLVDNLGRSWLSDEVAVTGRPGGPALAALHAQTVRVEPPADTGISLSNVRSVELVQVSDSGSLWVLDMSARRLGLTRVPDVQLPSVSLGRARVREGDSPRTRVAEVPFTVNGVVGQPASFGVAIDQFSFGDGTPALRRVVRLAPGQTGGVIEVPFRADRRRGLPRMVQPVFATGLDDVTMSTYGGRLTVIEDDPVPTVSIRPVDRRVPYGSPVQVAVTLSAPMSTTAFVDLRLVQVDGARQLRTDDVPRRWLERQVGAYEAGRPLAELLRRVGVQLDPGQRRAVLEIPTRGGGGGVSRVLGVELRDGSEPSRVVVRVG